MTTVGEILATERRRQGKTINDVVEGTKIRSRLIDALEQGDWDILPSPAYVKGYIQSYARVLEIPAEPLLEQYKKDTGDSVHKPGPTRPSYLDGIPAETVVPRREKAHEIPRKVWIAVAAGGVLVLLLLCVIAFLNGGANGADTDPALTPGAETTATAPGVGGETSSTTTVVNTPAGFRLRVSVRAGMASFVKVVYDGLTGVNGTMADGQSKEWRVTDTAEITVGKPDAVVVTRDGQPVTIPSTTNAKVTLSASE